MTKGVCRGRSWARVGGRNDGGAGGGSGTIVVACSTGYVAVRVIIWRCRTGVSRLRCSGSRGIKCPRIMASLTITIARCISRHTRTRIRSRTRCTPRCMHSSRVIASATTSTNRRIARRAWTGIRSNTGRTPSRSQRLRIITSTTTTTIQRITPRHRRTRIGNDTRRAAGGGQSSGVIASITASSAIGVSGYRWTMIATSEKIING